MDKFRVSTSVFISNISLAIIMSNTRLILSSRKPYNTTCHTEGGQAIYKVEAARPTLGARNIKIFKAVPPFIDDGDGELSKDSFGHLATIEYRMVQNSQIRMGSTMDVRTDEYFKKEGWNFLGRLVVLLHLEL